MFTNPYRIICIVILLLTCSVLVSRAESKQPNENRLVGFMVGFADQCISKINPDDIVGDKFKEFYLAKTAPNQKKEVEGLFQEGYEIGSIIKPPKGLERNYCLQTLIDSAIMGLQLKKPPYRYNKYIIEYGGKPILNSHF